MSNLLDGWDARVDRDYKKGATVRKLKRSIRKFMTLVGDLDVDEVRPTHGFAFADALLSQNPQYSRQSLRDYVSFCGSFFNTCVEQGLIDVNPFNRLNLQKRGREKANWLPFTKDELHKIFNYEWDEQLRLLLSILVTTGMRLEEAVALTWDRYNDTEHQGIRYFSLISTGFEEVDVKTESSVRYVLLHPDLKLPLKQDTGRLFTFAHNVAGSLINPVLRDLFNNPRKRTHSFRRSFKIMYRDQGVEERSIDALVGHGEGDASRQAYAGVGVPKRFEMLCKLEHPWLNQDAHKVHPE
jgi:integrase